MELLVSIAELRPATKVIIMTGYADTEMAIQALRLGAFDFLEKPIAVDLLYHTVKRALDTQCLELEHKKTLEELSHRNRELLETNEALAVLVKNIERTKQETERRIILQVRSLIMPIVENLRKDKNLRIYESQLVTLANYIEDITSGLATNLQETPSLSFRELRIALMIKYGMTSEEIAGHLHITLETVKTYRRSIRKKLGLTGTKHRLTAYLEHLEGNVNAIGRQCR
jgi:FixJ family two-component response regulator